MKRMPTGLPSVRAAKSAQSQLQVTDGGVTWTEFGLDLRFEDNSRGETADMNDHLFFQLPMQRTYVIETQHDSQKVRQYYTTRTNTQDRLAIFLSGIPPVLAPNHACYVPPPITKASTLLTRFSRRSILVETLAPPMMAMTGLVGWSSALPSASSSACMVRPA